VIDKVTGGIRGLDRLGSRSLLDGVVLICVAFGVLN